MLGVPAPPPIDGGLISSASSSPTYLFPAGIGEPRSSPQVAFSPVRPPQARSHCTESLSHVERLLSTLVYLGWCWTAAGLQGGCTGGEGGGDVCGGSGTDPD